MPFAYLVDWSTDPAVTAGRLYRAEPDGWHETCGGRCVDISFAVANRLARAASLAAGTWQLFCGRVSTAAEVRHAVAAQADYHAARSSMRRPDADER